MLYEPLLYLKGAIMLFAVLWAFDIFILGGKFARGGNTAIVLNRILNYLDFLI